MHEGRKVAVTRNLIRLSRRGHTVWKEFLGEFFNVGRLAELDGTSVASEFDAEEIAGLAMKLGKK